MAVTVLIYYTGEGNNAAVFAQEMCESGVVEAIRKEMGFTTLKYHRLDDMVESIGLDKCKLCTYCWDGKECPGKCK